MKKIIGIIGRPDINITGKKVFITIEYFKDITIDFNCLPIGILPNIKDVKQKLNNKEINELNSILKICDGIILQGGEDYYDYDKVVLKYAIDNDIPVLGICLGSQVMASLYENNIVEVDLKKYNNHNQEKKYSHSIIIDKNSKLYEILKKEKINVNSYHKERIKKPGIYTVSAYSPDGIIETLEYNKNRFNIGVQFHPEKNFKDKNMYKIFEAFFNTVKKDHAC